MAITPNKCPVCNAGFRAQASCPRCKTDLTALMRIAARAWAARQRCREQLGDGNLAAALRWSVAANRLQQSSSD